MITLEAPARGREGDLDEQQAQRAYEALDRYGDNLARHVYPRSPSEQTTAATLGAGLLAWAVAHHRHSRVAGWLAWAAAVVVAAAAEWSGVGLGMHWPTDVRGRAWSW